jgi:hypothetical protein
VLLKGVMMSKYGFVYVLSNTLMPNIYKIGYTNGSPTGRALELSRPTGVPKEYDLVCYGEMKCPQDFEKTLHSLYANFRSNVYREFFELNNDQIMKLKVLIQEESDTFAQGEGADYVHFEYFRLQKEKEKQDGKS